MSSVQGKIKYKIKAKNCYSQKHEWAVEKKKPVINKTFFHAVSTRYVSWKIIFQGSPKAGKNKMLKDDDCESAIPLRESYDSTKQH